MALTGHRRNRLTIATNHLSFLCIITQCRLLGEVPARRYDSRLQGDAWVRELMWEHYTIFFEETRMPPLTFRLQVRSIELNHQLIQQKNTSMSVE